MINWLLVDYGETISTPLPTSTIAALARLTDRKPTDFLNEYWLHRPTYDLGQSPTDYWANVLDHAPALTTKLVDTLTKIDIRGWMNINALTIQTLLQHKRRTGVRLALLSNAPEPLAHAIDRLSWAHHFTHRLYSCRSGLAKPDPAAFHAATNVLAAEPRETLFIDDRTDNTTAAASLGMSCLAFTSASALAAQLESLRPAQHQTHITSGN